MTAQTRKKFASVVSQVPQLARGQVWCTYCGTTYHLNSSTALASGWPKCCGYTMTIDSPDERRTFRNG